MARTRPAALRSWREDGEYVFRRGWRLDDDGKRRAVLIVLPAADHPSSSSLDRLTHEYELKDELDGAWAVRPLDLVRDAGRTMLVLVTNDPVLQGLNPDDRGNRQRRSLCQHRFCRVSVADAVRFSPPRAAAALGKIAPGTNVPVG
jgi:hypothetical protein